ncbi:unnamed protein product [Aphanomyces euteiches]|nr:hypothetical protein Ae201684P_004063 [Aphanomyces euteiches]
MPQSGAGDLEPTSEQYVEFSMRTQSLVNETILLTANRVGFYGQKVLDKMGLQVFAEKGVSTVCRGHLSMTLADVQYALYAATTDEVQTVAAILYGQQYEDAAVVHVAEMSSADDPFQFLGVKRVRLAKKGVFAKPTQSVYVEACGTRRDGGITRLYQVVEFVDVNYLLARTLLPVCTSISVFEPHPLDPKCVHVYSKVLYSKETPAYLMQIHHHTAYWQRHIALQSLPVARRLVSESSLTDPHVPRSTPKVCAVCDSPFKKLRPKHHCRRCCCTMCHACSIPIQLPSAMFKYCTRCVLQARTRDDGIEQAIGSRLSDHEFLSTLRPIEILPTVVAEALPPSPVIPPASPVKLPASPVKLPASPVKPPAPRIQQEAQVQALQRITSSLAEQEFLLLSMREALEVQHHANPVHVPEPLSTKRLDTTNTVLLPEPLLPTRSDAPDSRFEYL